MRIVIKYLSGAEAGRKEIFAPRRILIGRDQGCDIGFHQTKDLEVSGLHAEIVPRAEGRFEILDLHSTNGIRVNGQAVKRSPLSSGDEIELGPGGPRLRFLVREMRLRALLKRFLGASQETRHGHK